jgi:hypothetical protein
VLACRAWNVAGRPNSSPGGRPGGRAGVPARLEAAGDALAIREPDWACVQQYADAKTEVVEAIIARARAAAGGARAGP